MPSLEKARLMEIEADEAAKVVSGSEIPVQFNPASLKLSLANKVETQDTRGQQLRQYLGKTSTTLAFDLQFDTSDEGTTDSPVSVRSRTSAIERFVLPKGEGKQKQKPPKARFIWKDLQIDGIIEDLSIDFDLFAADGTPLRAKMSVTMKEQDAKYQRGKIGPGANSASGVTAPGGAGAGPGSFGASVGVSAGLSASVGLTDSTRLALSGESAAEFAARSGLDPAAWRGVTSGLDNTLSLKAGAEIDFNSALTSGGGVGVSVGVDAGVSASPEAKVGLDVQRAVPTRAGISLGSTGASAGFALAAAGGVAAAIQTVQAEKAGNAADATKAAFAGSSMVKRGRDESKHLSSTPDLRAASFGFGVPLRDRVSPGAEMRNGSLSGRIPLRPHGRASDAVDPNPDPTAAPWTRLPADKSRKIADAAQNARRPSRPCGCTGHCSHRSQ
jgi:hypothetical protein